MSKYLPTSPAFVFETICEQGLILPRPGGSAYLTEAHADMESQLASLKESLAVERSIPLGLRSRWSIIFDAISTFVSVTHETYWLSVYGEGFRRRVVDVLFGRNLRVELCRPQNFRRRIMISGEVGTGRQGMGDTMRRLAVECLVRRLSAGLDTGSSRSAKVSSGDDSIESEVFGGFRSGTTEQAVGLLSECADSVLFLDGVLSMPERLKRRLLNCLEDVPAIHSGGRSSVGTNVHLVSGVQSYELDALDEPNSVTQALFQSLCHDGLLTIPRLSDMLQSPTCWADLFPVVYGHIARAYCGVPTHSIHRYGGQSRGFDSDENLTQETLESEQAAFLDWVDDTERVTRLSEVVGEQFRGYEWPGNLRELEALMRRLIEAQDTHTLNLHKIQTTCDEFRRRGTGISGAHDLASAWLTRFEHDLESLPLTDNALPQVISSIETRYFREAAERAAMARKPRMARIQDVARILGIPRQTAARKWQQYGLSSSLLTKE